MKVEFSAKVEVEDAVKAKAQEQMDKFMADFATQKITSAHIHFAAERAFQIVEIQLNAKNLSLHAAAKQDNVYAALAKAFDKLNTQMSRYLDKIKDSAVKANPALKDKIWKSSDLKEEADDADLDGYKYEL